MSSEISQKMHNKMSNVEMQNLFRTDRKEKKKKNSFNSYTLEKQDKKYWTDRIAWTEKRRRKEVIWKARITLSSNETKSSRKRINMEKSKPQVRPDRN